MLTVGLYGIKDTTCGGRPTYTHDHSLAFLRDGRVLDVVALERLTRTKHDNRLEDHIGRLLSERVGDEPLRFVSVNAFVGDHFCASDGNFRIEPCAPVLVSPDPVPARVRWWPDGLRPRPAEGWALCHEVAHLGSVLPFVGRFEPGSLLVHIDGGASDSACSAWWWDGQRAHLIERSWELLKEPVNNFNVGPVGHLALGLTPADHLSMPGKLMGFAGHGRPDPALLRWLTEHHFLHGATDAQAKVVLETTFGPHPPYADLVATIQADFEARVCAQIYTWQERCGARHLYYAGGAALNIPTNAVLETSGRFRSVHVPPCTNDTGLALGAAAWLEYRDRGEVALHDAFLSKADEGPVDLSAIPEIARAIAAGQVLGICNGPAEIGPRALGHRSIIARPDSIPLRQRVSEQIKRREAYRPVAPVLLAELAEKAFVAGLRDSHLSRFMLGAYALRPEWQPAFVGVLHADGTLRAQVVRDDPFLEQLLGELWRNHGIAGLINTSFNGPGEPIVHTHADALACAKALPLDGVVLDGSLHRP